MKLLGHAPIDESRWEGRPVAAALVRGLVMFGPFAVSAIAVWIAAEQLVPHDASLGTVVLFWIGLSAIASGLLFVVDHQARRLIPLALMLDLSLVFPDKAPSRMLMAMGTMNARELEQELREARATGSSDTLAEAAERLLRLVTALGQHDWTTRGHSERVRAYCQVIAAEMGLSSHDRDLLNWAALIHDVGKLTVPSDLLNKRGDLTPAELDVVRRHAEEGVRLVEPLRDWLGEWCEAVADHHEKWDGSGYPNGLSGSDISLGGRIVAVADAFDVMTSPRSYSRMRSVADARKELVDCSGTHFDPAVVRAMLSMSVGGMRPAIGPLAWLAYLPAVARVPWSSVSASGTSIGSVGAATVAIVALPVAPVDAIAAPLALIGGKEAVTYVAPAPSPAVSLEDAVRAQGATLSKPPKDVPGAGDRPDLANRPSPNGSDARAPEFGGSPGDGATPLEPRRVAAEPPASAVAPDTEEPTAGDPADEITIDPADPGSGSGSSEGGEGGSGGPPPESPPPESPPTGDGNSAPPSGGVNPEGPGNGNAQGNGNGQGNGNANGNGQGNGNDITGDVNQGNGSGAANGNSNRPVRS